MSHISRWLAPPFRKITIQESALAVLLVLARAELAFRSLGSVKPAMPEAPMVRTFLRFRSVSWVMVRMIFCITNGVYASLKYLLAAHRLGNSNICLYFR